MKILSKAEGEHGLLELESSSPQTVKGTVYFDNAYFNKVPFVDVDNVSVQLATLNSLDVTTKTKDGTHIATLKWGLIEYELYAPSYDLANYMTLNTVQTVTGTKTFSNPAFRGQLVVERSESSNDSVIAFRNNKGLLGCLGYRGADGVACVWDGDTGTGVPIATQTWVSSNASVAKKLFSKNDYQWYVVLLCKKGINTSKTGHRLTGKLYTQYTGSQRYYAADVDFWYSNWNNGENINVCLDTYGVTGTQWDIVSVTYQGTAYYALRFRNTQAIDAYFLGTSKDMLFTAIHYYTSNTQTVVNSEIYNSIAEVSYNGRTAKGSLTVNGSITTSSKLTINNGASLEVQGNAFIGGKLYAGLSTNNPYATQSWVTGKGYATTTQLANYLPLAGGTMNKGALIQWADGNGDYDWSTNLGKGFKIIDYNINAPVNEYSLGLHIGGAYYKAQLAYNFSNRHWKYRDGASSLGNWKWLIDSTGGTIDGDLTVKGSLTAEADIFGNGWSVEGGIANFGELNATDVYADSVTVGDTSVASKSYSIPAVSDKRWVRIAEMTSYVSCGTITISKNYNNTPIQHAVFHVQSGYVGSNEIKAEYNITQLACTCDPKSDQYFTRVRIVYANPTTSTSKAYVEVYCNFVKAETLKVSLSGCTNMSLLSAYTLGSVPTGYDYRSIYLQPGGARNECYQMIDLSASKYYRDYFYPVVGSKLSASGGFTRIEVRNNLNDELEDNVPSWSTHTRGFTANMVVYARGSEWGVNVGQTFCVDYNYSFTAKNPVGYSQMANTSLPVLWLRGGGKYNVYTDRLMRWKVKTSTFTSSSESVTPQSGGTAPFRFTKANLYANMVGYVNSSNANTFTAKQSFTAEIEVSKTDMVAPITIQGANNRSFVKFTSGTTNLGFLGFNGVNTPAWMPNDATEYIPLASQSWVNTKAQQVGVTANGTYITFGDEDTSIFASGTIVMRGEVQLGSTYGYGFSETGAGVLLSLKAQTITQTSDLTRKNILEDVLFTVDDIAAAPFVKFQWNDRHNDLDVNVGSIAQYWKNILPEAIHGKVGENLSMEYQTIALGSSIITAREVVKLKEEIKSLKEKIVELEKSKE